MNETAKITIELDRKTQLEVENICHEKGISFSNWFSYVHNEYMRSTDLKKDASYNTLESNIIEDKPKRAPKKKLEI